MAKRIPTRWFFWLVLLASLLAPAAGGLAFQPPAGAALATSNVTAFDLIIAMNTLRASYGLPQLVEDPIVDAVAQSTADIMAANEMSWHIGDVRGRLAAAGYGGGATVWATENFAMGYDYGIDNIMQVWSDASHMIPAVNPAYCNVGAGVADAANGMTYYVLQAAYTSAKSCGEYKSVGGEKTKPGGSTDEGRVSGVSQLIVPVKIATPDEEGLIFHVVQAGQSFWSIAIAYKITIRDLEIWNNISRESGLQIGQKLFIPGKDTKGYATPTPVGMVQVSTPDAGGKVVHTVQSYQTLTTIAKAYSTTIDRILALNGILVDTPLQIGQELLIDPGYVTSSPTSRPLTPIERLTPASDGKYYHTVQSGENLSWIAGYYGISLTDLMNWNGLDSTSILRPDQKLLLQVTLPATITPTPGPATATWTATPTPPVSSATQAPTLAATDPPLVEEAPSSGGSRSFIWLVPLGLAAGGALLVVLMTRRRHE